MPAQWFLFVIYSVFLTIIFPFSAINLVIVKTNLIPDIKSFIVASNSMNPSLKKGNLIYTLKSDEYSVGDIVTFKDSVGRVTHRITGAREISGEIYYQTKGDANNRTDEELISGENIYGKTFAVLPNIGNALLMIKNLENK